MIKKWDDHFPDENSLVTVQQITPQFQTTALFVQSGLPT